MHQLLPDPGVILAQPCAGTLFLSRHVCVCLCPCLSVCLSACLSVWLSVSVSLSLCLSACLSACAFICVCACACVSACVFNHGKLYVQIHSLHCWLQPRGQVEFEQQIRNCGIVQGTETADSMDASPASSRDPLAPCPRSPPPHLQPSNAMSQATPDNKLVHQVSACRASLRTFFKRGKSPSAMLATSQTELCC